jgi:nucleotide-binding universal stress UspA family protein
MKILVGYDSSKVSQNVIDYTLKYAKAFGATVHVALSMTKGDEDETKNIAAAEDALAYAKDFFAKNEVPCETHLLIRGLSPGEDLVKFAQEQEIDTIMVGVQRVSRVSKLVMGSTAQYVILKAKCPVVSIK